MEISESFRVDAPPEAVASLLLDVDAVAHCVPGVQEVTDEGGGTYSAVLAVRMGPINARFGGSLQLDGAEAPGRLRASGKGRDRSTNSQVSVDMTADLVPVEDGTEVNVLAEVAIRGRLGQFGTGVIQSTASEMTKAFATCLRSKLDARAPSPEPATEEPVSGPSTSTVAGGPAAGSSAPYAPAPAPAPPSFQRIVLRGVWASVRGFFRRLLRRPDRR